MRKPTDPEPAHVLASYAIEGVTHVCGVTHDGTFVWFNEGPEGALVRFDPATHRVVDRIEGVGATGGIAFDGRNVWAVCDDVIKKVDGGTKRVVATIPAPHKEHNSGLAWAEGFLWLGQYEASRILKLDPATGKVLKTIASDRFVTGVSAADGGLWHGAERHVGDAHDTQLRLIDIETGEVRRALQLPADVDVSGVEADGAGRLWCGDYVRGRLNAVRR